MSDPLTKGIVCQRCRKVIQVACTCKVPLLPEDHRDTCERKRYYHTQTEAERALRIATDQWHQNPARASHPPDRVYQCPECEGWHLTHKKRAS